MLSSVNFEVLDDQNLFYQWAYTTVRASGERIPGAVRSLREGLYLMLKVRLKTITSIDESILGSFAYGENAKIGWVATFPLLILRLWYRDRCFDRCNLFDSTNARKHPEGRPWSKPIMRQCVCEDRRRKTGSYLHFREDLATQLASREEVGHDRAKDWAKPTRARTMSQQIFDRPAYLGKLKCTHTHKDEHAHLWQRMYVLSGRCLRY